MSVVVLGVEGVMVRRRGLFFFSIALASVAVDRHEDGKPVCREVVLKSRMREVGELSPALGAPFGKLCSSSRAFLQV